ncbi:hypothetical protein ACFVT6_29460 [Streptomyces sp. NPDC058049]|uniref:hypothetical protein n=1 Tax=Streptomyces sp. NPDC058049 TaxID=3346314 RepID=UPI0036EC20F9
MSGDGADVDVSKQALGQIAKGITDTLGELKELGMVGSASMGRGFSDLALTSWCTASPRRSGSRRST